MSLRLIWQKRQWQQDKTANLALFKGNRIHTCTYRATPPTSTCEWHRPTLLNCCRLNMCGVQTDRVAAAALLHCIKSLVNKWMDSLHRNTRRQMDTGKCWVNVYTFMSVTYSIDMGIENVVIGIMLLVWGPYDDEEIIFSVYFTWELKNGHETNSLDDRCSHAWAHTVWLL